MEKYTEAFCSITGDKVSKIRARSPATLVVGGIARSHPFY